MFRRAWPLARPTAFTRSSLIQTRSGWKKNEVLAELGRYDAARDKTAADLHALVSKGGQPGGAAEAGHLSGPRVDPARSDIHGQNPRLDRR